MERERERVCVRVCVCACVRESEREVTVCVAFRRPHLAVSHLNTSVEQDLYQHPMALVNTNTKKALTDTRISIPTGSY